MFKRKNFFFSICLAPSTIFSGKKKGAFFVGTDGAILLFQNFQKNLGMKILYIRTARRKKEVA